jgi:hypothetical protein
MMQQTTNAIVLIRPLDFRMNEQTARTNYYQKQIGNVLPATIQNKVLKEFDAFVALLRDVGVNTVVINDTQEFDTPDAIFPNNWISLHQNGVVGVYPLFAQNRRLERREEILVNLEAFGYKIDQIIDYTSAEDEGFFLEGTGSMVLDRANRKAYCALSSRTDEDLFIEFCEDFEFTPVIFSANQTINNELKVVFHTNLMLCIAENFAIVCLEVIKDKKERKKIIANLKANEKEIITITTNQLNSFAGNVLQVRGQNDKRYLVMSHRAYNSLSLLQIEIIENHCEIITAHLETIETYGGGSVRGMIAEIFLPKD